MPEIDLPLTSGGGVATAGRASERTASILETELATPKDRVAAQVLDAAFCILLFWYGASAVALHYGRIAIMVQHHEIRSTVGQLAIALFALTAGVYFFVMEWLAGASIGKLLCRLRVTSTDGGRCGFAGALLRNLLRPIDTLTTSLLVLVPPRRQRLGDRIADTVVTRQKHMFVAAADAPLAGWERRAQAAIIDLLILVVLASAYLAITGCIRTQSGIEIELRGYPLTMLLILVFFYHVIPEGVYGATPGKALTGLRVVSLSCGQCDFTAATLRSLLRPVDALPLVLPALLLIRFTRNRQRLGDLVAGTVVLLVKKMP